jgi:hypothetical protein
MTVRLWKKSGRGEFKFDIPYDKSPEDTRNRRIKPQSDKGHIQQAYSWYNITWVKAESIPSEVSNKTWVSTLSQYNAWILSQSSKTKESDKKEANRKRRT